MVQTPDDAVPRPLQGHGVSQRTDFHGGGKNAVARPGRRISGNAAISSTKPPRASVITKSPFWAPVCCWISPSTYLADTFDKVVLVDILHLPVVQKRVWAFANVELFTNDHTGVAKTTWDHVQQGRTGALPSAPPSHLADTGPCGDSDLVVSANLLTQLPLMP